VDQRIEERREYSWKFPHELRLRVRDREDGELVVSIESNGTCPAADLAAAKTDETCVEPQV
jgi:hypothetical protein